MTWGVTDKEEQKFLKASPTFEELALKHAKMKRCKPITDDPLTTGCGEYKNIKEYPHTFRDKGYGKRKYLGNWCRECQKARDRLRRHHEKTNGKHGLQKDIIHTGPVGIDKAFFCKLEPTPLSSVIRELKQEAKCL
jgi:hypothetical protein